LERRNRIFKDIASTIFAAIRRDSAIWLQDRLVIKVADILARSEINHPDIIGYSLEELLEHFRSGCNRYGHIFDTSNVKENLQGIMQLTEDDFYLDDDLWVTIILDLLLEYSFADEQKQEDILGALTAVYNGRVASYLLQMKAFADKISGVDAREKNRLLVRMMESIRHDLTNNFWDMKPHFNQRWLNKKEQVKPPIIPLGYMEYVPGKPIVVPKKITGKDQRIIQTDNIFRNLRKLYDERLTIFLTEGLGLSEDVESVDAVASVMDFMRQLEDTIDILMPGDIHTREGLELFITSLLNLYPEQHMFTINSDLLREMLIRFPPVNLMIPLGYYKPDQLIQNMDPRDAVTYANLVENWSYSDRDLIWLIENLKPESFEFVPIKPIILTDDLQMGVLSPGKISNFNRITARITVKTLETGKGGQYPKLRYLTNFVRRLSVAENYSQLFKDIVSERKNMGPKIRNTLLGVQKSEEFSANNIFENYHHRSLVDKISYLAERLRSEGGKDLARIFELMVNGYGLSQVLEDGTFLTCTAWSWGSYSFKGGLKIPTPLTTSVESRWFNHEFLEMLYRELGYNPEEIKEIVYRLIQSGKGRHNLLDTLLPARPKDVTVVVQETTNEPSKYLKRYKGNPLLEPDEKSKWESKYVLNPGALRIHDKVYLFYRAVGDDNISHIGLAITDGYKVLERLPQPVLSPVTPEEKMGCEDPRLTIINDKIFMLYTAYDGNIAQIAAVSIRVDEFLTGNYTGWKREGLAFKNIWDKDAIIFPEKIKDKYVVYHRIEPSIWVTYINDIKFPIKEKHAIIIGPRPGRMWDSLKIGAGAQPLKTKYGWLLIYHGVDYNYVYRLGVILVDLQNPSKVLYRSPNPILEPEEDYEIGLSGAWVPNVVFTCGAVPAAEKEVLEDEDEILVYYGAADTSIGMASATLADLIPESFRIVP
ncbi:MAG: glycosidase, partial [Syntrophomonadaceae bacterium]|nr:glycosidase [Syntrophomonadaceae bacterium]